MRHQAQERPELVIALVCPLGVRIDVLETDICDELQKFGYDCERIQLSGLLKNLDLWEPDKDEREETRISHRQRCAFEFRRGGGADAMARAAIAVIRERRMARSGDPDKPANSCAYVLRQLKRPEEVELLRDVYGQSVVVVGGHAREQTRIEALADTIAQKNGKASSAEFKNDAERLIHIDEKENHPDDEDAKLGQNTRDTYPLADCFVSLEHGASDGVRRFIRLMFGHPSETPTPDEMAMYQANAIALRSSDERRQVGAVIVKRTKRSDSSNIADADIVASGMNEVPRRQGGFYWNGESPDGRDPALRQRSQGVDLEDRIKADVIGEILQRLKRYKWLAPEYLALDDTELNARGTKLVPLLKRTQFTDISEFMRQVHAEMAALVDAAKRGTAVRGCEMYVTTFPCHNCAKHIIAAGITRVIYLEPYPKSRAEMLHRDEIVLGPTEPHAVGDRVLFVPFSGIAPRQYARLFRMADRGKKYGLRLDEWERKKRDLYPREILRNSHLAYTRAEREELDKLPADYSWDRERLSPAKQ